MSTSACQMPTRSEPSASVLTAAAPSSSRAHQRPTSWACQSERSLIRRSPRHGFRFGSRVGTRGSSCRLRSSSTPEGSGDIPEHWPKPYASRPIVDLCSYELEASDPTRCCAPLSRVRADTRPSDHRRCAKLGLARKIHNDARRFVSSVPRPLREVSRAWPCEDASVDRRGAALRRPRRSPVLLRRAQPVGKAPPFGMAHLHGRQIAGQEDQHEDPLDGAISCLRCTVTLGSRHKDRSAVPLLTGSRLGSLNPESPASRMLAPHPARRPHCHASHCAGRV
jgi:hypothetical protein